jgi:hypothetical protein
MFAQNQIVQGNPHFGALNQKRLARNFPSPHERQQARAQGVASFQPDGERQATRRAWPGY